MRLDHYRGYSGDESADSIDYSPPSTDPPDALIPRTTMATPSSSTLSTASATSEQTIAPTIHECKQKFATPRGIQPYTPGSDWSAWKFSFQMAILSRDAANDETTSSDKIKLSLLTLLGTEAIHDLMLWTAPAVPSDKSLKELYEILDAQYGIHNEVQLNRLQLFELQQGDKDLRAFYREVNRIAGQCAFDKLTDVRLAMTALAFVKGISDPYIKERLLDPVNDSKTGTELLTTALAANTAKKAVQYSTYPERKALQAKRNSRSELCTSCGSERHVEKYCHKRLICNGCGKKGHIRRQCRESRKSKRQRTQSEDSEDARSVKYVEQRKSPETLWRAETPETLWRGAYQIQCAAKEEPPTTTSPTVSDYEGSFGCDSNLKDTIKEKIVKEVEDPENNVGNSCEVNPTHKRGDSNSAHQRAVSNSDPVQQQVPKSTESATNVDQLMNSASQEGLPRCDEQTEEADLESFTNRTYNLWGRNAGGS